MNFTKDVLLPVFYSTYCRVVACVCFNSLKVGNIPNVVQDSELMLIYSTNRKRKQLGKKHLDIAPPAIMLVLLHSLSKRSYKVVLHRPVGQVSYKEVGQIQSVAHKPRAGTVNSSNNEVGVNDNTNLLSANQRSLSNEGLPLHCSA